MVQYSKRKLSRPSINVCKRNYAKQNHNVNINRVESGDENQEADVTTNRPYNANCYANNKLKSRIITNLVVMFCYTAE